MALLTIAGETLIATLDHPFFTLERGWQRVSELAPGDDVRRADGSYGVVSGVETIHLAQRMYNITVDWAHTYYVGDQAWLVHNAACPITNRRGVPYPDVEIPGYGKVPFPEGPYTPNNTNLRNKEFTQAFKSSFRVWWEKQGYSWPEGRDIQIHHIKPLKYGGTNIYENFVPLSTENHKPFTSWWRSFQP